MQRTKEYYIAKLIDLTAKTLSGKVTDPSKAFDLVRAYGFMDQEYFLVITLNAASEKINLHVITKGLVNRTMVHSREVFRAAIADNSTSIFIAHNHPTNNLVPSAEDREITSRLMSAATIIGISILDHLIIGRDGYYSFTEKGEL